MYMVFTYLPLFTQMASDKYDRAFTIIMIHQHKNISNSLQDPRSSEIPLQGFHNMTTNLKWYVTFPKNNRVHLLNMIHQPTKYEISKLSYLRYCMF